MTSRHYACAPTSSCAINRNSLARNRIFFIERLYWIEGKVTAWSQTVSGLNSEGWSVFLVADGNCLMVLWPHYSAAIMKCCCCFFHFRLVWTLISKSQTLKQIRYSTKEMLKSLSKIWGASPPLSISQPQNKITNSPYLAVFLTSTF